MRVSAGGAARSLHLQAMCTHDLAGGSKVLYHRCATYRCRRRGIDLLDGPPTLRRENDRLADAAIAIPASKRFAAWSRRYLMIVAGSDALVGDIAAAILHQSAIHSPDAVPLICW